MGASEMRWAPGLSMKLAIDMGQIS